jgi:ATP-dependent DNA helicase PIF1
MVTDRANLQPKQQLLFDTVCTHYNDTLDFGLVEQLLLHVDGEGGTGKTTVVLSMCYELENTADEHALSSPVLRAAPTGVAAHNIMGKTLHSLFKLPVKKSDFQPLAKAAIKSMQAQWKGVKYLVIDKKSMVSLKTLSWVHRRCLEIWPEH